jgi:hypothetical protein
VSSAKTAQAATVVFQRIRRDELKQLLSYLLPLKDWNLQCLRSSRSCWTGGGSRWVLSSVRSARASPWSWSAGHSEVSLSTSLVLQSAVHSEISPQVIQGSVHKSYWGQCAGHTEASPPVILRSICREHRGQSFGHTEVRKPETRRPVYRSYRGQSAGNTVVNLLTTLRSVTGNTEVICRSYWGQSAGNTEVSLPVIVRSVFREHRSQPVRLTEVSLPVFWRSVIGMLVWPVLWRSAYLSYGGITGA